MSLKNHFYLRRYMLLLGPIMALLLSSCGYNKLVNHEENVNKAWSAMENYCQQRIDIAGQVVETYSNEQNIKKDVLKFVADNKAKAAQLSALMDPGKLHQGYISDYENTQQALDSSLHTFVNALQQSGNINEELSDTRKKLHSLDLKINEAVQKYNEAALNYNSSRQRIWHIFIASIAGFGPKGYFLKISESK